MAKMIAGLDRDEQEQEVEITPEMIEAGVAIFREWEEAIDCEDAAPVLTPYVERLIIRIFRLGFRASPDGHDKTHRNLVPTAGFSAPP